MKTIYNYCHPDKPISKGLIEIINVYEDNYYIIALDGKIIEEIHGGSYESTILKRKFINPCCAQCGLSENQLDFVIIDWYNFANQVIPDYDGNDFFADYKIFINFLDEHGNIWENYIRKLATGISQLEDTI